MTEAQKTGQPSGNLFLYRKPELLTESEHGHLGITPSDTPYAFAAGARAVPVTLAEIWAAHRDYPIVFTNMEAPFPVAVLGIAEDRNLFMQDGHWEKGRYVPAYLRCHPFAFAAEQEGRVAVAVDRDADTVTENPKYPFFAEGKLAKETEDLMRFVAQYETERRRTVEFCQQLKELGLLAAQRATYTPTGESEEKTLANYVSIDADKLSKLDDASVLALHKAGRLSAAYLQLHSLENWQAMLDRWQGPQGS